MSFAKRQRDMKDPAVRKRIEEFLREGDAIAEKIMVAADGVEIVLTIEGEAGRCEVRMNLDEAERFEQVIQRVLTILARRAEAEKARGAIRVDRVDDEEDGA